MAQTNGIESIMGFNNFGNRYSLYHDRQRQGTQPSSQMHNDKSQYHHSNHSNRYDSMHQSSNQKESKIDNDDHVSSASMDISSSHLRQYAPRPVSCNGDCGAIFSKMINNIIHPKVLCSVTSYDYKLLLSLFE